jgi:hypothetical protein
MHNRFNNRKQNRTVRGSAPSPPRSPSATAAPATAASQTAPSAARRPPPGAPRARRTRGAPPSCLAARWVALGHSSLSHQHALPHATQHTTQHTKPTVLITPPHHPGRALARDRPHRLRMERRRLQRGQGGHPFSHPGRQSEDPVWGQGGRRDRRHVSAAAGAGQPFKRRGVPAGGWVGWGWLLGVGVTVGVHAGGGVGACWEWGAVK